MISKANPPIPDTDKPLSRRLRNVSFGGHDQENDEFTAAPGDFYMGILTGGLTRAQIGMNVYLHYLIYTELEAAADSHVAKQPDFPFHFPELHRVPALVRDLEYWLGAQWQAQVHTTENTEIYATRIREVCFDSVPMYVAHQYTRYLADLSGGQFIGRKFRQAYGLNDTVNHAGAEFHDFPDIVGTPQEFKDHYRNVLDAYPFSEHDKRAIEDEVRYCYLLNNRMAADLEAELHAQ
ncbi:MAG: biliverdin-producing heme oxygenase [Bowdeniella nasicola]|nr:biliverdin-producing heme oxygenase [Bowdeniella nasicola]